MNDLVPALTVLIIFAGIWFGIFLLIRQITLWYFRLNEIANNLAKIAHATEYIATQTMPVGHQAPNPSVPSMATRQFPTSRPPAP